MAKFRPGQSGNPKGLPKAQKFLHQDGWASAFTGIGTAGRDKRLTHQYTSSSLPYMEIARLWEKNDIVAKAIEAPAAEVFREGHEFVINDEGASNDLVGEVEEKLEEIGLDDALETAWQFKRAFGGSAVLLGTDDSRTLEEPVDEDRPGRLKHLTVFEPFELTPVSTYQDPGAEKYGQPEYFQINNYMEAGSMFLGHKSDKVRRPVGHPGQLIHESRLMIFQGIKTSRFLPSSNDISQFWGSSVVDRFIDQARDMDVGFASAGIMATDLSQPVITIEGLREMVAKSEAKFRARIAALELGRSTARAIILGDKEKFERQTTNISGVPEILDRLSVRTSAAIGIPLCILLGYSPTALGQPGEVELRLWYNIVRALQRRQFSPPIKRVARAYMRGMRQRGIPKRFGIGWHELEHLNSMQQAEAELNQARTDSLNIKSGMIHSQEARDSRWRNGFSFKTNIDSKKKAPGFMAPPPAGVVPGTTPGGGKPTAGVTVTPHVRRTPAATSLDSKPKEGGDKAPGNRDAAGTSELEYQQAMLDRAIADGADPAVLKFLEKLIDLEESMVDAELEAAVKQIEQRGDSDDGAGPMCVFAGMNVCLESPKGSSREWVDTDGTAGVTKMKYDYGYVLGTTGADADAVDVYLGPSESSEWVYVIHQQSKASGFVAFDEDKVMLGFDSPNHAKDAYLAHYDDERFFGGMDVISLEVFKSKLWRVEGEAITS